MVGSMRAFSVVAFAVVALAGGGVAAGASIDHAGRVIDANRRIEQAHDARADYQDARYRLAAAVRRFSELDAVSTTLPRLEVVADSSTVARLDRALQVGRDVVGSRGIAEPAAGPTGRLPRIEDETDWAQVDAALAAASRLADEWRVAERRVAGPATFFAGLVADAEALLEATAELARSRVEPLLAAHGSATPASRDGLVHAAAALEGEVETVAALAAYADAVDALRESHRAEQERLAADAAAAAAAAKSAGSSPKRSGGRAGGGAGGGGAGGGGSGGTGSGGGTPAAPDTRRYADPRGGYSPGCRLGPELDRHDPGPGGTSIITKTTPYDFRIDGDWVVVYICSW